MYPQLIVSDRRGRYLHSPALVRGVRVQASFFHTLVSLPFSNMIQTQLSSFLDIE